MHEILVRICDLQIFLFPLLPFANKIMYILSSPVKDTNYFFSKLMTPYEVLILNFFCHIYLPQISQ